jgi:hypothetical protein
MTKPTSNEAESVTYHPFLADTLLQLTEEGFSGPQLLEIVVIWMDLQTEPDAAAVRERLIEHCKKIAAGEAVDLT